MAHGPKWGSNGPKMVKKWDWGAFISSTFPISGRGPFSIFRPFFPPFSAFGPFSILYQAAWLAMLEQITG